MVQLLLVDDEIHAIQGIESEVDWQELGISRLHTSLNARKAKEVFSQFPIDILLCDIEMPEINGIELTAWVKEHYPETRCLFLTCHSEFHYAKEAIHLGTSEYLLKPVTKEELEAAISKAIEEVHKSKEQVAALYVYEKYNRLLPKKHAETSTVVDKVKQYILDHLDQNVTREQVASHVYLNQDYLARIFKKETGISVMDYLLELRISTACEWLLATELPVSSIAEKVGIPNFSYFARLFRKQINMSPVESKDSTMSKNQTRLSLTRKESIRIMSVISSVIIRLAINLFPICDNPLLSSLCGAGCIRRSHTKRPATSCVSS
jgi:YesN/AraC family two-component response regulator